MSNGIFIGIGDKAQKVTKIYIGVGDKARKVLKGYIGDANSKARQFYTAEKSHWWRRYNIDNWTQEVMSLLGGTLSGGNDGEYGANESNIILRPSYSFDTQTGYFTLSGSVTVTWVFDHSDEIASWYDLHDSCTGTYTANPIWWTPATNTRKIWRVQSGTGIISSYANDYMISLNYGSYAKPQSHVSSYVLVKGTSASKPPISLSERMDSNGYWYSYGGEWDAETYREYDQYYWEYDGFY